MNGGRIRIETEGARRAGGGPQPRQPFVGAGYSPQRNSTERRLASTARTRRSGSARNLVLRRNHFRRDAGIKPGRAIVDMHRRGTDDGRTAPADVKKLFAGPTGSRRCVFP